MVASIPNNFSEFIKFRNEQKYIYTAGPASLVEENLLGMRPCFGRGDKDYSQIENYVLSKLKKLSNHKELVRLQGAASLALEIMALNFLYGNVLIISTGFYSDRLIQLPLGIFAIAAATVILPALSNAAVLKNDFEFNEKFNWALKFIFIVGIPSSVGLYFLSLEIISILFLRG